MTVYLFSSYTDGIPPFILSMTDRNAFHRAVKCYFFGAICNLFLVYVCECIYCFLYIFVECFFVLFCSLGNHLCVIVCFFPGKNLCAGLAFYYLLLFILLCKTSIRV